MPVWQERIIDAMRGVSPEAWWRTNLRIESGELWVGGSTTARWAQRVVRITRPRVLELAARRDADLAALTVACAGAERDLRAATRVLVDAFGPSGAASILAVSPRILRTLCSERRLTPGEATVLRHSA